MDAVLVRFVLLPGFLIRSRKELYLRTVCTSSIFPYCATLLERYRHDSRVWCIMAITFRTVSGVEMAAITSVATTIAGVGLVGVSVGNITMLIC